MSDEEYMSDEKSESDGDFSASEDEWKPSKKDKEDSSDSDFDLPVKNETDDDDEGSKKSKKGTKSTKRATVPKIKYGNPKKRLQSLRDKLFNKYKPPPKIASPAKVNETLSEILGSAKYQSKKTLSRSQITNDGGDSDSSGDDHLVDPNKVDLSSSYFQKSFEENSEEKSAVPEFDCSIGCLSDSEEDDDVSDDGISKTNVSTEKLDLKSFDSFNRNMEDAKQMLKNYTRDQTVDRSSNIVDVKTLLAMGETVADVAEIPSSGQNSKKKLSQKTKKPAAGQKRKKNEDSDSDWEEVDEIDEPVPTVSSKIPKEGLQVVVELPGQTAKRNTMLDVEMEIKRKLNKIKRENQLDLHKTNILCWIAHMNAVNPVLNDVELMAEINKQIPSKTCYPRDKTDINYFDQITKWYKSLITLREDGVYPNMRNRPKLEHSLSLQIKNKAAICKRDYVFIFVLLARSLGLQCRVVMNLVTAPIRPLMSDLCRISEKKPEDNTKKEQKSVNEKKKKSAKKSKVEPMEKIPQLDGNDDVIETHKGQRLTRLRVLRSKTNVLPGITPLAATKSEESQQNPTIIKAKPAQPKEIKAETGSSSAKQKATSSKLTSKRIFLPPVKVTNAKADPKAKPVNTKISVDEKKSTQSTNSKNKINYELIVKSKLSPLKSPVPSTSKATATVTSTTSTSPTKDKSNSLQKSKARSHDANTNNICVTKNIKIIQLSPIKPSASTYPVASSSKPRSQPSHDADTNTITLTKNIKTIKLSPTKTSASTSLSIQLSAAKTSASTYPVVSHLPSSSGIKRSLSSGAKRTKSTAKYIESDDDFSPSPVKKILKTAAKSTISVKKLPQKAKILDRRVLSTDDETDIKSDKKIKGCDYWVEVYSEKSKKWCCIDLFRCVVGEVEELTKYITHPIAYVFAWNNDNTLKDVSSRYCTQWHTVTRKMRVSEAWLTKATRGFIGKPNARDKKEDRDLAKKHLDQELPKTITECKDHPRFALSRHLLKFQALYPQDALILGYIRNEPVYARECVHTLHSREIWVKQARVVKPKEEPYKIVKAMPKWDRASNTVIKDRPLELFGLWQTQEYDPPTAENGIVPRNPYGNVELFKACMLPKKTVHLQLPGLNRTCKKLNIDCAPAVVGFDFHCGSSHPVFDGFVVCEEFAEKATEAWFVDQEEAELKEQAKYEKRVYGNWRKLIRGLRIREKLKIKYKYESLKSADVDDDWANEEKSKKKSGKN